LRPFFFAMPSPRISIIAQFRVTDYFTSEQLFEAERNQ
jgi:hypothetical protein